MTLTPPQIRAAELLGKGHSQQETADLIGISRRTIVRWLKQEDFKSLCYGLVGRAQSPQPTLQRASECHRQSNSLTPQDLVGDALEAVRDILQNPDSRAADRLKAAALVGDWVGLSQKKTAMHEMEGLESLIKAGWVPDSVLEVLIEGSNELNEVVKSAFRNCYKNGI